MSRPIAVLRPEPGNRVTAIAIEATGRTAIRLPLFDATPVAWQAPDPAGYDALILTSANAIRHGGPGLLALRDLPVYAVGAVTAEAARRAGFRVEATGDAGAEQLLERAGAAGVRRALHIAGRDRTVEPGGIVADIVTVYVSEALDISTSDAAKLAGSVALVKSARAGARLAQIVDRHGVDRATIVLVAISERTAEVSGTGWERVVVPADISSAGLIHAAIALAD
jgi:uroporphyrinogen-III synthase